MPREIPVGTGTMTRMLRDANHVDGAEFLELHPDDARFAWVMPPQSDYVCPPLGTKAKIRISGVSDTFELESNFGDNGPKITTNLRLEFQLVKVATPKLQYLEGKRFSCIYSYVVSDRSNLGMLLGALLGEKLTGRPPIDVDHFIGTEFVAQTSLSNNGNYARISPDAIEFGKTKLSPFLTEPTPELVGVTANGAEDENPFEDDL